MKLRNMSGLWLIFVAAVLGLLSACASFKNGAPPTKVEQGLFTIQTNYVPVLIVSTNHDAQGQPIIVTMTNLQPTYTYTPGQGVKDVQTGLGLIPAYGGLAGTAAGALAALWGWFRSSKNYKTGATLAQSIETMREFIKQLPNGVNYDNELTAWLQKHQADTGTVNDVLNLLEKEVSNDDAQTAAEQIRATIQSLNPSVLPPKPPGT